MWCDPAQAFRLPPGLERVYSLVLTRYGLIADRYQQHHGNALVFGGQLTVYRDISGKNVAVIGAYYPNPAPRNQVRLNKKAAHGIAAKQIGKDGDWYVDLMLNPKTGTYFYRVENRRFDSRWFHWIDAESGAILNAYETTSRF